MKLRRYGLDTANSVNIMQIIDVDTCRPVKIGKLHGSACCMSGVPAKRFEVVMTCAWELVTHVEVCLREGLYTDTAAPRLTFRHMPPGKWQEQGEDGKNMRLLIDWNDSSVVVRILTPDPDGVTAHQWDLPRRRNVANELTVEGIRRMVAWHRERYYRLAEITDEVISMIAEEVWCELDVDRHGGISLCYLNRVVSRTLYRYLRHAGYRKLCRRQQERYGTDKTWVSEIAWQDIIAGRLGSPTGCGEYTLNAAHPMVEVIRRSVSAL